MDLTVAILSDRSGSKTETYVKLNKLVFYSHYVDIVSIWVVHLIKFEETLRKKGYCDIL